MVLSDSEADSEEKLIFLLILTFTVLLHISKLQKLSKLPNQHQKMQTQSQEQKESQVRVEFNRIMNMTSDRRLPYRRRTHDRKTNVHWGQRKLLMSEIEFLTMYGELSSTVLYVGAADGQHIALLTHMFPKHKFILYDPSPFHKCLKNLENVEIHSELFLDHHVAQYADQRLLFVSDIRIVPDSYKNGDLNDESTNAELEKNVKNDMQLQQQWFLALRPAAAMMKFRLPYEPGTTEYLKGQIYYQCWAPATSTETRLIIPPELCANPEFVTYDHTAYESIMYRFNLCTRNQPCSLPIALQDRTLYSYDMWAEQYILAGYLSDAGISMQDMPLALLGMHQTLDKFFQKTIYDKKREKQDTSNQKRLKHKLKHHQEKSM